MKKLVAFMMTAALLLSMNISANATDLTEADDAQTVTIKIVHTNDTHGRAYAGQDNPRAGTLSAIAGFDKVKAVANSVDVAYGEQESGFYP